MCSQTSEKDSVQKIHVTLFKYVSLHDEASRKFNSYNVNQQNEHTSLYHNHVLKYINMRYSFTHSKLQAAPITLQI